MRAVIDLVEYSINPYARYKKHHSPSAESDIKALSDAYSQSNVHKMTSGRKSKDHYPDIMQSGWQEQRLASAVRRWQKGRMRERCDENDYTAIIDP